jgi:predicted O-methyltransferase YrrM
MSSFFISMTPSFLARRFFRVKAFLRYFWKAGTLFQVHSPFIYKFCEEVLEDEREYYAFSDADWMRSGLLQDTKKISDSPLGARKQETREVKVSHLVKTSSTPAWWGKLLFRIARTYQPKIILELGTSLGIGTLYLAKANSRSKVYTLEGHKAVAQIASEVLKNANTENAQILLGTFEESLSWLFEKEEHFDLVYLDGHHNKAATVQYFEQLLPHLPDSGIIILDDINWSAEMWEAWNVIKAHPHVTATIDLYRMGILFFNPDLKGKQDFTLIPLRYKPWRRYIL